MLIPDSASCLMWHLSCPLDMSGVLWIGKSENVLGTGLILSGKWPTEKISWNCRNVVNVLKLSVLIV